MCPHTDIVQTMIIIPLVISALAVIITLFYASRLDILDRRVPFTTWLPMLIIGLPLAGIAFLFLNDGLSLFIGYLGIVSVILFIAYLGNRDDKKPLKTLLVIPVIAVQIFSAWYFSWINGTSGTVISVLSLLIVAYATYLETRNRENTFSELWPLLYFLTGALCWFSYALTGGGIPFLYLGLIEMFCLIFYLFGILQLFGGADAWALIFITLIIPLFPFEPFAGYPAV